MTTLALVLTDLEGSTRLWAEYPAAMHVAMERHHQLVHAAVADHGGHRPPDQGEGDAVFAAFPSVLDALTAVIDFQRSIAAETWPSGIELRDRVAIHVGDVNERDGNLFGSPINHTARIRGLAAGGQVLISGAALGLAHAQLPDDWAIVDLGEHRLKDVDLPERLFQVTVDDLPADFPPLMGVDNAAHGFPVVANAFVGRSREISELGELLRRERLVTVLGFGGMGKTRLASSVAMARAAGFRDGAWFVDLSPITAARQVALTVARSLGVGVGVDGAHEAVLDSLSGKHALLVLDNLEQLLPDAAAFMNDLLSASPQLHLLVTSRRPLRLQSEHVFPLESLEAPPIPPRPDHQYEPEQLQKYGAVRLLLDRVQAVRPDFALTSHNAAAIAEICARLDGLPLALELAAARMRSISPAALLARLGEALRMLRGGSSDLPDRHQALEATIRWSVDDLAENDRVLLARLSVFPGSFTLDAAELVGGTPADALEAPDVDVIDGLTSLIDRSLLRHHEDLSGSGEDRYSLLVPIREFGTRMLEGDREPAYRHAETYRAAVVLPPRPFMRQDLTRRNRVVVEDWHNVRAAFQTFHNEGRIEPQLEIGASVGRALRDAGRYGDARDVMDIAVSVLPSRATSWAHVALLVDYGRLELSSQRLDAARPWGPRSIEAARELGDPSMLVLALCRSAIFEIDRDKFERLYAECESTLASLSERPHVLPTWYVSDAFTEAAINMWHLDPVRTEGIQRRRFEEAPPETVDKERLGLAYVLSMARRNEAALEVLAVLLENNDRPHTPASVLAEAAVYAACAHIGLRQWEAAQAVLMLAARRLDTVDMPDYSLQVQIATAAVDRHLGEVARAATALESVLAETVSPTRRAEASFLLAVLRREEGRDDDATLLLEAASTIALDPALDIPEISNQCLLERAAALEHSDAETALLLVAAVRAAPSPYPDYSGVAYDEDSMLARLTDRVGTDRTRVLLAAPLPPHDELWERSKRTHHP